MLAMKITHDWNVFFQVCGLSLLCISLSVASKKKGNPPVGPQLYNFFGLGGFDPYGQLAAPRHVYSGPYYDIGPIQRVNYRRKRDTYGAPSPSYGAPSHSYGPPPNSYGAPSHKAPKSSYGVPSSSYGAPSSSYGAPSSSYGVPSYGSGGGYSGGKKGGRTGIFKRMRNMFRGMKSSFDQYGKLILN